MVGSAASYPDPNRLPYEALSAAVADGTVQAGTGG